MKQPKLFADLHVHPHYFKYWDLRWREGYDVFAGQLVPASDEAAIRHILHNAEIKSKRNSTPNFKEFRLGGKQEVISKSKQGKEKRSAMGGDYSQSNPEQMQQANAMLAVISLSPVERGWFIGKQASHLPHNAGFFRRVLMSLTSSWEYRYAPHILAPEYDYFHEMVREYYFYHAEAEPQLKTSAAHAADMVSSGSQLDKLHQTEVPLCVFSLESLYILSQKPVRTDSQDQKIKLDTLPIQQVLQRIDLLKKPELFPYPFFYITYSHHFSSGYAGHAKSIPNLFGSPPSNQREMLYQGLSERINENIAIISKLLCIEDIHTIPLPEVYISSAMNLLYNHRVQPNERRILIDVKHLSPKGRQEYYDWFIRPQFNKPEYERIPVLATHMGYSGIEALSQFHADPEIENNNSLQYRMIPGMNPALIRDHGCSLLKGKVPFLTWGINTCDEDIAVILKSRGLIGICFDQRILGCEFKPHRTAIGDRIAWDVSYPEEVGFGYIWASILSMAYSAFTMCKEGKYDLDMRDTKYIWKMFTLGTDYDGLIDPPYGFSTVKSYPAFANSLWLEASSLQNTMDDTYHISDVSYDISERTGKVSDTGSGADALMERICWLNLYEFVHRNWHKTTGINS